MRMTKYWLNFLYYVIYIAKYKYIFIFQISVNKFKNCKFTDLCLWSFYKKLVMKNKRQKSIVFK